MKLSKVFGIVLSLHVGVILLVMFQPSCQTTGGRTKAMETNQTKLPSESNEQSFNQAVEGTDQPVSPVLTQEKKEELVPPQRPASGALIVPQETSSPEPVSPSIIVPQESVPPVMNLKPSDLSIYKVVRGDTLWGIARKNGVSFANLLKANPNMDKSGRLSIGQEIMIPASSANLTKDVNPVPLAEPPSVLSANSYKVEKGDTLSRIARKHNLRLSELLKANNMSMSSIIRPGQILSIPSGTGNQQSLSQQAPGVAPRIVPPGATTHVIKKGENLSRIASIYGVTVSQIMELNGLSNPSLIRAGQSLIISNGAESTPGSSVISEPATEESVVPVDDGGTLQDFFNDTSVEDRPIIDAP
jgi:LysM repeat protein